MFIFLLHTPLQDHAGFVPDSSQEFVRVSSCCRFTGSGPTANLARPRELKPIGDKHASEKYPAIPLLH
jgi:hypothetical protein